MNNIKNPSDNQVLKTRQTQQHPIHQEQQQQKTRQDHGSKKQGSNAEQHSTNPVLLEHELPELRMFR